MNIGKVIVQTKRLRLTEMIDSDREEALRLFCQIDPTASIWADKVEAIRETLYDIIWKEINRDTFNCIIRNHEGVFIGRISMQHLSEERPEIGIELFEQYRNQRIGPEAVELLFPGSNKFIEIRILWSESSRITAIANTFLRSWALCMSVSTLNSGQQH